MVTGKGWGDELDFTDEEFDKLQDRVMRLTDKQRAEFFQEIGIPFSDDQDPKKLAKEISFDESFSAITEADSKDIVYEALEKYGV